MKSILQMDLPRSSYTFTIFFLYLPLFLVFFAMLTTLSNAATAEKNLRAKLITGNDRWARPVAHSKDVVNVTFAAAVYQGLSNNSSSTRIQLIETNYHKTWN